MTTVDSQTTTHRVAERLVTLATFAANWPAAGQVIVRYDAVVTPAVRDELRRRKLTLVREAAAATPATTPRLAIVSLAAERSELASRMANGMGVAIERLIAADLPDAIRQLTEQVAQDRRAVFITTEPTAALVHANRHEPIRAAWGITLAAVRDAVKHIAPNVLILQPGNHTVHELKNILKAFVL